MDSLTPSGEHKHVWVEVWRSRTRRLYRCDIRGFRGNWKFCGAVGYGV